MKKHNALWILGLSLGLTVAPLSMAETVNTVGAANGIARSLDESIMEFHQGDEIPVSIKAGGDLIETKGQAIQYIVVKRDFWIRIRNDEFQISLDGNNYKPMTDAMKGALSIGVDASGDLSIGVQSLLR